jgi:hypothetical protein
MTKKEEKARNKLVDRIFQLIHDQLDIDDVESQMGGEIFDATIEEFYQIIKAG